MNFLKPKSIRTIFSLAFTLQVLTPVGMVSYIAWENAQQSVEQLADQLMQRTSDRIASYLKNSMTDAGVILKNNVYSIENNYIKFDQLDNWRSYFFEQIKLSDQIAYVYFGKVNGEYVEIAHVSHIQPTRFTYRVVSPNQIGTRQLYQLQETTGEIDRLLDLAPYDPRVRPWYQTGRQANQPLWTNVYQFAENPRALGISLVQNQYNAQNQFQGVLGVDFTLLNLNQILRDSNSLRTGQVFIMERDGTLIATSSGQQPYDQQIKRIKATQLNHPLLRAVAQELQAQIQTSEIISPHTLKITLNGQLNYARTVRIQDQQGLDWIVVVAMPESDFMQEIWQQRRIAALWTGLATIVALAMSYWFGRWITQPIVQLSQLSQRIAAGDFEAAIPVRSSREVNQLARSFDHMRNELQKNQSALEEQAHILEEKVAARSSELQQEITARQQTKQFLENTLNQLQTTQDQLVRSAKLAALGELIAAVAHEMNTPLSTIQFTAQRLAGDLVQDFEQLPQLVQQLPEHLHLAFFKLSQQALQDPQFAQKSHSNYFAETASTQELLALTITQLEQFNIPNANSIAEKMISWGIADQVIEFIPLLKTPHGPEIIQMLDNLSTCANRLQTINVATNSAAKVVSALKSYSHQSHRKEELEINLLDNLETAITLYYHQIKNNITLNRLYQPISNVLGSPEELAQVWTNLIQNALYAMPQGGTLTIKVQPFDSDTVQVKIADTGAGIPLEVQSRVFEPFFTTKPSGQGNGLGLSIVKRIVDRHGGKIAVSSQLGCTEIIVTLPVITTLPTHSTTTL